MGCSTFSQYTVVSKYSVVAINVRSLASTLGLKGPHSRLQKKAPLDKAALLGCGITQAGSLQHHPPSLTPF
jgi:S-(hydroxymethyl)glutathione dehydrogenase/alcohol dehydrogenase